MCKLILCLFSLCLGLSLSAQNVPSQEKLWEECVEKNPGVSSIAVKEFYQKNAPDLLKELSFFLREDSSQARVFLQQLVTGYLELQKILVENPVLYQWQLRRLGEEVKIRRLSAEIKLLDGYMQDKSAPEKTAKLLELHQKKQELKKLLEEAFNNFQQHQQIEINRLEAEMQILKQLLEERSVSKDMILEEQYRKLTGTSW